MSFPPNVDPKSFTLIAFILGFALIDDLTANEQNAVGNWLVLVGQVLETSSAQQQVIEERINGNTININSKNYKNTKDPYMHNPPLYDKTNNITKEDLNLIKNVINKMQTEINILINKK